MDMFRDVVGEKDPFGSHARHPGSDVENLPLRLAASHLVAEHDRVDPCGEHAVACRLREVVPVRAAGVGEDAESATGSGQTRDHRQHVGAEREHVAHGVGEPLRIGIGARPAAECTMKSAPVDAAALDGLVQFRIEQHRGGHSVG